MISVRPDEKSVNLKIASLEIPVYFSPIYIPQSHAGTAGPFDHTMASGYFVSDLSEHFQAPKFIHSGHELDGVVVRVPESQMDAVTAVAGSGPGYIFLMAEAMLDAALAEGLPEDVANVLVRQLFRGAGILLADSDESPATLRERVTSPNGTTAAGLAQFEAAGLRETVNKVVRAAAARSAEMGAVNK
jgi:hypothetical protein